MKHDAIDMLKGQHLELRALFRKIKRLERCRMKEVLFVEIADMLALHTAIEQKHFAPAVRARSNHIRLESAEEHGPMREAMTELLKIDTADEVFDTKLERLVEVVDRHANEQEQHLFPVAAQTLNDADLADLAKQMRGTMELLDGQGCPRYSLVQPTHPVPLKYAAPRFDPTSLPNRGGSSRLPQSTHRLEHDPTLSSNIGYLPLTLDEPCFCSAAFCR